ncbi:uncharacterized protein LOC103950231 isoform X2 [Pyrus x bretschneideri]|uniref:uncharacterized protein LOC103950231 isoform X2 n=1 Tax=Pyrus x bretschneideri TaxID=225117 RepID=UPI002030220E|nr:uncharacterized protein LOC103950231 isoform X2 [Pyrus x bretschneideri]
MSNLSSNLTHQSAFTPCFSPRHAFQIHEFSVFRRRRLKPVPRSQLGIGIPFHEFISRFPSPNSLDFIAPVLGFVSGATHFLSNNPNSNPNPNSVERKFDSDIGEWVMFTSPTPFNRFVLLRCPTVSFQCSELLEDLNKKLVKEDRHFVRLSSGRIRFDLGSETGSLVEKKFDYQRLCISTDDGGVVSLDWPANLDLREEYGLDTTLVLVPGTAMGSLDWSVRSFVCEALRQGCFPIVMNPRGCAGSPLTTPRLFSAADSDDISTAIQFITKARPWTTLMGVGWGYGANMLTKYLAEAGESTPLTAATCIDNPFDLEEATRSSPHQTAIDQSLTDGFLDILRSNKELFQGKPKGFDVEQALSAKSVRDFDKAISMVSYGYEAIEDFYSISSTRGVIGNVKIPVLFIQKDDGSAPLFSVPRSLIAENPFTSLLLRSYLSSTVTDGGGSALSWCQHITIEWLTAVELGLLKGRHPLLKDVDLPIDPSEGPADKMPEENDTAASFRIRSRKDSERKYEVQNTGLQDVDNGKDSDRKSEVQNTGLQDVENGSLDQTNSDDRELVNEEEVNPVDEKGQVLQTAEVVMNMLDVTMPDTLTEEKKKKVLTAVDQGDTLMKALQDAVPEDVRGKLTSAVSGALHTQGTKLKFDQLLGVARIPDMSSGLKSKIEDKVMETSSSEGVQKENCSSDLLKKHGDLVDSSINELPDANKPPGGLESEDPPAEGSEKISNLDQSQSLSSQESDISGSVGKDSSKSGNDSSKEKASEDLSNSEKSSNLDQSQSLSSQESDITGSVGKDTRESGNDKSSKEKAPEDLSNSEKGSELEKNPNNSSQVEIVGGTEEAVVEEQRDQDGRNTPSDMKKEEENDIQKKDNKNVQPVADQSKNFSVSEALDALTGMDDNTQMAVNNIFGVIENMITQMGESSEQESEVKEVDSVAQSEFAEDHVNDDNSQEDSEASKTDQNVQMDTLSNVRVFDHPGNGMDLQPDAPNGWVEKSNHTPPSAYRNTLNNSQGSDAVNNIDDDKNEKKDELVGPNLLAGSVDKLNHEKKAPVSITSIPNGVNTLLSKVPDESLDLDSTTALLLDYFPEEGQWKLLEKPGHVSDGTVATHRGIDSKIHTHSPAKVNGKVIEPSYAILDTERHQEPVKEYETVENIEGRVKIGEEKVGEFMRFVKNIILNTLKIEVGRRVSEDDMKNMEPYLSKDMEQVANAVSFDVGYDKYAPCLEVEYHSIIDCTTQKVGTLHGEHIIRAISSSVQGTSYLRRVLPIGVIVGSSLAALRKYFDVVTIHNYGQIEALTLSRAKVSGKKDLGKASGTEIQHMPVDKSDRSASLDSSVNREGEKNWLKNINNSVMVGAVTAAPGASASALFVEHQDSYKGDETSGESLSKSLVKGKGQKEPDMFEEAEKNQSNIVTSLAEKAMSVAAPVVPTKEDGEVDQERLVTMLTDLGQKGGMLRLVGKAALLWGGLRGAMSLTDKLIQFLDIAERPLIQRIFGFVGMVLVLWSPIVVPLLPSFLQSWTTNTSSRIAELACIVGLYTAFMILVVIWGKRIRGYENPLHRYGLDLTSLPKLGDFLKGLVGGVALVLSIHSVRALLDSANLSWPSTPSSLDAVSQLKLCTQGLVMVGQGVIVATGIALVEELLFRAWLPQEIAADLGYHRGIIISGLAFALSQRSPLSTPGLWLLSLGLAGARQRNEGSLSIPIGLRAGIIASIFIIQKGGFLTYRGNFPPWLMGTQSFQPFSGLIGFAFTLVLALALYPTQPLREENAERTTEEFKKHHAGE